MTTLKNQIAEWFEMENGFFPMQEIIDRFSGYRESDVRDAVRQLCDEGILYGGNFIDDCYGYAGESQDEDEYDCMTEIDTLSNLTSDMFSNVSALAEAMEIDLGTIGDTKYSRYDWTFTQGKRQRGNGWSIAIPDEFSIVPSSEGRTFEAVPSDEVGNMFPFVRVLPGDVVTGVEQFHHPYALKGSIALKKEYVCQQWADNFGFFPEALDVELPDGMGYICVVPLNNGQNFSFQSSLFIGEKMYVFRVDTGLITDTNLEKLKNSVLKWLKTFKVEGNISKKPNMFESAKIISDLKQGRTNTFDKAVDEAQTEYNVAVNGQFQYLHTVAEYIGLEKDAKKIIKDVLLRGMELKEYYYESANKLVEKLKQERISETTLRKVYLKLKVFEEYQKTVDVEGNNIKVGLSERIKEIQQNWNGKVDAAIEVNPTLKKCKEVEPLLKKIKEAKRLEEEKKRAEAEKKAREAEEKRLKEEKRKDEIYNTIIASDPKTVSDVESIIKKLEGLGDWKDSASKLKEYKEKLAALKAEEKRVQEEKRLAAEKKRKEEEERKRIRKEKYDAYLEKYPLKKEEPKIKQEIESLKKEIDSIVILEKKTFKFLGIFFVVGLLDLVLGIASEMAFVAVIGVVCTLLFGFVMFMGIKANITKSSNKRMKQKKLAELEAKMQEISSIPEFKE